MKHKEISEPKNNKAAVLYSLIFHGKAKGVQLQMTDYRKRLSELKLDNGLLFDSVPTKFLNRYGRWGICSTYVLKTPLNEAIELYKKINKDEV